MCIYQFRHCKRSKSWRKERTENDVKWGKFFFNGIYNFRVTKSIYKTELRIMTKQAELLTLKFYFFPFFELLDLNKSLI